MLLSEKQRTPNRRLPRFGNGQRGFALVIALALMAFVLALILSITTLVRVETAAGDTQLKQLEARQNAILGMIVGLGELQKQTGPDRRSTATAARLDSDPDTVDIDGPAQSRWTGVWSLPEDAASPDGVDPRAAPEHLAWLVSHDPSDATDPFADPSDPVVLASAIDNPDEDALFEFDAVRVPKRTFGEGRSALAYWIEDEGAKAKLNAVAPNYDPDAPPRIPLGNGATAFGQLEGGLNRATDWQPGFPFAFDTTLPIQQVIAPADPSGLAAELIPHTTMFGHGVLADSVRGGLKLDLSAILEMDADTFEEEIVDPLLPGDRIYEAYLAGESNGQGPRWDLLRQYKTLGENVDTNNIATIRPENTENLRVTRPGIYPIIERFQLYVVLRLSPDLTPDEPFATYRPRIYLLPAVVIWNPYDRALTATDGLRVVWRTQGQTQGRVFAFNYAAGRYDSGLQWQPFEISNGAATGEFTEFITATGGAQTSLAFRLRGEGGSDGFTLPPGEARVFTLTGNSPGRGTGAGTEMRPGFRSFGLYLDADHTFEVPDSEEDSTKYLDIRTRTKENLDLDDRDERIVQFPAFRLHLRTPLPDSEFLQRIENLRWNPEDRAEANSRTVSELSSHSSGTDTNGSKPFPLNPRALPGGNTEIVDSANFPFPSGYEIGLRTPNPSITGDAFFRALGERLLAFNNPRGGINTEPMGKKHEIITRRYYQNILLDNPALGRLTDENYLIDTWNDADTATFVGYSDGIGIGTGGQERFALFHLPNETDRLRSIGELRHLDLVGNNLSLLQNQAVGWRKRSAGPAFVVGEARADPYIPLTEYFSRPDVGNDFNHADHQWLANRQIWDRFFVSTVPPDGSFDFPLPNGRMEPVVRPSQGEAADPDRYRDPRTTAANLWMDGAFNINSVSVPAWKALLSQFVGQPVETENAGTFRDNDASPFPDLPEPFQGPYTGGNSEADTLYTGFRKLDPGEIDTLAREIVRQIKLRGPFTNLADFINRSIAEAADVPDGLTAHAGDGSTLPDLPTMAQLAEDPRLFGLLQAAIESANLNDDLHDGSLDADDGAYVGQDTEPFRNTNDGLLTLPAGFGPFMEGAPGYMTQGKLLQRLGPVLSARSDTFRIRAYGETTDSITGENVATAYCEAIVQRFPQYVDADADVAETPPDNLSSDANRRFGRQYRVIAFRWLSEDDI